MAAEARAAGSAPRGRPHAADRRMVAERLMRAAATAMLDKPPADITMREIARDAGVDEAMIKYYFGGKDELFAAIWKDFIGTAPTDINENAVGTRCLEARSIAPLIAELAHFYCDNPQIILANTLEMHRKGSRLKSASKRPKLILEVIQLLKTSGIYHRDIDERHFALVTMSLVLGPILIPSMLRFLGLGFQDLRADTRIALVAKAIDDQCLAAR